MEIEAKAVDTIKKYADNGRDAVNLIELGTGLVCVDGRREITFEDIEWILAQGRHVPRSVLRINKVPAIGSALGLAVFGPGLATVIEVETQTIENPGGTRGEVMITGIIEEEELGKAGHTYRRKSMVLSSVENVRTALTACADIRPYNYDIHVNFPGGTPVDGPSAGLAIAISMYSAINNTPVQPGIAFTGEISIRGDVRPVGGIPQKLQAAQEAGVSKVFIPSGNWQDRFAEKRINIIPVSKLTEVLSRVFEPKLYSVSKVN